jgi:hypothetical protein
MGVGAYMALAPALALASGVATHKYLQSIGSGTDERVEALREQIDERAGKAPPEVFAQLTPVDEFGKPIDMNKKKNKKIYGPTAGAANGLKEASTTIPDNRTRELNARATLFVQEFLGVG